MCVCIFLFRYVWTHPCEQTSSCGGQEQPMWVGSLLPPCRLQGLNLGHQTWWPVPTEPPHQPSSFGDYFEFRAITEHLPSTYQDLGSISGNTYTLKITFKDKNSPISLFSLTKHRNSVPGINSHHFRRTSYGQMDKYNRNIPEDPFDPFTSRPYCDDAIEVVLRKRGHLNWRCDKRCRQQSCDLLF